MQTGADTGLRVVRKAWERAEQVQSKRNDIYLRLEQRYKGFNPNVTDPYRSNMVMPKLYTAIETIAPRISKAIFGKRPYIPIKSEKNPDAAKAIELALDSYLYRGRFKIKGGQLIKMIALFGTGFLEPVPARMYVREKRMVPSPVYPWQPIEQEVQIPRFYLDIRQYAPWQVYVEPHMMSFDDPGYAIITEIVAKSEIRRMIEAGRYPGVDPEKLSAEGETEDKKFSEKMFAALNIARPDEDMDYGVLMRYQSKERYITVWNGIMELEDGDNPYKHGQINLTRFTWNADPFLQNSFWGQPEGKVCEALLDKLDESRNQVADNNDIINQAVIGYRDQAVEPEHIVFVGGARIPIKGTFNGSIRDAIDVIETRGLPADAYQLPMIYDMEVDRAMGVYAPNRGENTPDTDQTATEASLISSQGDLRNEFRAEMFENLGLAEFSDKCTSHIDQFTDFQDWFAEIGEMALLTQTMNPQMLPGGFSYQFRGSDEIINSYQVKADLRANMDVLSQNPAVWPDSLARIVADKGIGLDERETKDLVMSREEFMGMLAQQKQAEDEARMKDLEADIIRAKVQAGSKEQASKPKPKGKASQPKRKSAVTPNISEPAGRAA